MKKNSSILRLLSAVLAAILVFAAFSCTHPAFSLADGEAGIAEAMDSPDYGSPENWAYFELG